MSEIFELAHSFNNQYFESRCLLHLSSSFSDSYKAIVQQYPTSPFIKVYDGADIQTRTFSEFDADVQQAVTQIGQHSDGSSLFVSISGNTYLHTVFLVAAHLRGLTICPINAEDDVVSIEKKLAALPVHPMVWSDIQSVKSDALKIHRLTITSTSPSAPPLGSVNKFPASQPFALIFTSGSTGYSKIVEQMEFNVLANVDALIEHHSLGVDKTIATSLPLFHVNTLYFSFFSTLLSGAKFVLYRKFDLRTVSQSLRNDQVSVLSAIPTLLKVMVDRSADFLPLDFSLKYVVSAAAPLSKDLSARFLDTFQRPLIQGYGLSEAINFSALLPAHSSLKENKKWLTDFAHPSIGPSLPGNEICLLNTEGARCLEGEIGEVCIRGWSVMRSYVGTDPRQLYHDGFLHTGDLAYFKLNEARVPYYFICGRIKDVLKKNGETVSLREVDDEIIKYLPLGSDAIAVGFNNQHSGEDVGLVATVHATEQDAFLKALMTVPKRLRPAVVLFSTDTLRTASGKPQRWKFAHCFSNFHSDFLSSKIKKGQT